MRYALVDPERALATQSADGNWVWTFVLDERDGETRLISRNRFRLPGLKDRIGMIPMEPGSLVMERKMLRGIKERAERLAAATPRGDASGDDGGSSRRRTGTMAAEPATGGGER
jgi:hypothetical protein